MKIPFLLFICLLFGLGCHTNRGLPPPPPTVEDADQRCYPNGSLSAADRKKIYPFNAAAQVVVIAFDSALGKAPLENNRLVAAQTKERIALSDAQIDRLTDILYNYGYSSSTRLIEQTVSGCYYPRHALLFEDKQGKVLSYLELCLECRRIKTSLPEKSTGVFCEGKYALLEAFFREVGVRYFK